MKKKNQTEKRVRYTHIQDEERVEIAFLKKKGYGVSDIANALKRSKGTISEELKRNRVKGGYDARKAQHKAYVRRKYSKYQGMKVTGNQQLRAYTEEKLRADWSPEEIAGRLKNVDKHIRYASYGAIYKFIDSVHGRTLEKRLRYKGGKKKRARREKTAQLQNRLFIEKRPQIIEKRQRFGDWEGDFIVSGKNGSGVLLVLHERKARYVLIKKIASKNPELVSRDLEELFGIIVRFNSLTLDNDIVFRKHEELSELLGVPIYFCHPYHSWEKGGVENTNKLIRQYIPKGSGISAFSDEYIQDVENKLNHRPRKCLHYRTPLEVMLHHNQLKTLEYFCANMYKKENNFSIKQKQPSVRLEG